MGSVWRAQHLTLRSPVAIKLIDPSLASSEEALARFLREAQAAASLRSPHVVQILDHGVDAGVPYIAMELLDGESLADRLTRKGKLSLAETARFMTHTARAMSRAHEAGIVHRDLKPDNIFIVHNEDEEIAKVLDFGIAKAKSSSFDVTTGTRTGAMMGTPYYMSPEQVEGSKTIDHRADLWAMAVITFECVTGARPFDGETLGSLLLQICARALPVPSQHGQVPPGFDAWFLRATQRAPDERFQSAREMVDALRTVLGPISTGALATPPSANLGTARQAVAATDTSSVALHGDATERDPNAQSSLYPAGVPRRSHMPLLLIGGGVLILLAVAGLLFFGSGDQTQTHVVRPAPQARAAVPSSPPPEVTAPPAPGSLPAAKTAPVASDAPAVDAPPVRTPVAPAAKPSAAHKTPPPPAVPTRAPPARRKLTDLGF
jgi:serine/threonine-protein kinase